MTELAISTSALPTEDEALAWIARCKANTTQISVDTETTGIFGMRVGEDYCMGISVAYFLDSQIEASYFPLYHPAGGNYSRAVFLALQDLIENAERIVFHNAKFDLVSLSTIGINYTGEFYCTLIISNLINENFPYSKDLSSLCKRYVGPNVAKEMPQWLANYIKAFGWEMVTGQMMYSYATQDARITLQLLVAIWPLFLKEATEEIWQHKQKLVRTVIKMEAAGVGLDVPMVEQLIAQGEQVMAEMTGELNFNAASSQQKEEFLIHQLNLPVLKRSPKTGRPSFDKTVMPIYEELLVKQFPGDERVQRILVYNGWKQALGLFYKSWLEHLDADGRLRTNYVLHKDEKDGGTVTGRLSSRRPNLQQIPRVGSKPWNKLTKKCFKAKPGFTLIEADYSQLELRLATAYAKEQGLIDIFNEGRDIFSEMAAQLNMTRQDTKTLVYSLQYGAGVTRISNVFKISSQEAQWRKANYFNTYPGFAMISYKAQETAMRIGKVPLWSQYRHFVDRESEAHKALNAIIQGGSADIVERTMVRVQEEIVNDECVLLLQVHDSLIFEVLETKVEDYAYKIKETMEDIKSICDFGVKFAVDVHFLSGGKVI